MKTILRRLSQLEARVAPKVNIRLERAAAILSERRKARGKTDDELDWSLRLPHGTRLSCAETLRYALRLKRERALRETARRPPLESSRSRG
jgi:hypothetical protein